MEGVGRGDPAFRVTGEESNPYAEISFFSKIYQECVVRVFAKSVRENRCKTKWAVGFLRRQDTDPDPPLP